MYSKLVSANKPKKSDLLIFLVDKEADLSKIDLPENFITYIKKQLNENAKSVSVFYNAPISVLYIDDEDVSTQLRESVRKMGAAMIPKLNSQRIKSVFITDLSQVDRAAYFFAEGMTLANYQFEKYKKEKDKNALQEIRIGDKLITQSMLDRMQNVIDSVFEVRTLVNEPLNFLTATQLSKEIKRLGKASGFSVEVYEKKKIESLKMGGILAVNLGSIEPPTFSILEWKPKKAMNKQPIVLVGKGVVYDTGGLSLKPTANSMDFMKCDMAGAGAVIGAVNAVALNKLPLHVIGLVPATDNRPGGNAYVPGDVIKMYDGTTVEVLNTDAEGRMLLADSLAFAKSYKPELVINLATLTGASVRALGDCASALFGTASDEVKDSLKASGFSTHERLVEFPLWKEYGDMLRSDIADLKNLGGPMAGQITAAKFLQHFTDYPWMHIDIAGPAWLHRKRGYESKGGTGVGVRLLYHFLKKRSEV